MSEGKSLQETYGPKTICFGCGPANEKGLRIRSFVEGDQFVARWRAEPHHQAFPGVLNGGIIGALLDCHMNWASAYAIMQKSPTPDVLPSTVTADYSIKLKRPTPVDGEILVRAKVLSVEGDKAVVEGSIEAGGKITATSTGTFIAVKEGHPAFHRW